MNPRKLNQLMSTLLGISSLIIVIGALFKLQHFAYGDIIFWSGIWTNFVLSTYEINRLRKIIARSDKETVSEKTST